MGKKCEKNTFQFSLSLLRHSITNCHGFFKAFGSPVQYCEERRAGYLRRIHATNQTRDRAEGHTWVEALLWRQRVSQGAAV